MAYSSSPAASSFYSSMIPTEYSPSLKSAVTPHRHRADSRFHHSKSHSISGSRETTPVRAVGTPSRPANSERYDRQKTASLPLPKRRQLSLSANSSGDPRGDDDREHVEKSRANVLCEDVYNLSNVGDNCSFVTITGTAFSNRRDSNCTLNSNSYKEQYILGSNYNNNINRHSQEHYDSMLLSSTAVRRKEKDHEDQLPQSGGLAEQHLAVAARKQKEAEAIVDVKSHHYETNSKSLEDIL